MYRIGPGPGKYALPTTIGHNSHDARKWRQPMYSIGKRPDELGIDVGPGPAKYNTERLSRFGTKHHQGYMGLSCHLSQIDRTPAANAYKIPEIIGNNRTKMYKTKSPDYFIGERIDIIFDDRTPGPNKYKLPALFEENKGAAFKQKAPAYSFAIRNSEVLDSKSPGPAKYYPGANDQHKIQTTIKLRSNDALRNETPAPNHYDLNRYKPGRRTPAFTMGIRHPDWKQPMFVEDDIINV